MKASLRSVLYDPYFLIGMIVRLVLILCAVPAVQRSWFVPFVEQGVRAFSIDPWSLHLARAGDPMAFPYGPIMYAVFAIGVAPAVLIEAFTGLSVTHIFFALTILAVELLLLRVMAAFTKDHRNALIWFLWLSPMAIYVSYWHGQIDIVPVAFLALTFLLLKHERARAAGFALGLGVAAKLSVLLAAPFFLVYLWRNARWRALLVPFAIAFGVTMACGTAVCLLSPGYRSIVLGSPELGKVYRVSMPLGGGMQLFILPILYSLILYSAWRLERMSYELFFIFVGIAFFAVLLLTPASTGWFVWILPFVALIQAKAGRTTAMLGVLFSTLFVITNFFFASGASVPLLGVNLDEPIFSYSNETGQFEHSMLLSATWSVGLLLVLQMFIHGIRRNDYFRLSRRPLSLGIAGDSGCGKDTLAAALAGLFGDECVTNICGDDYHKWDRQAPMWKVLTHLDPRGNDLGRFTKDVLLLLDGKPVISRHYDHETGRFRRAAKVSRNDVVIVSGLHVLFINAIRDRLDLSIFLEMEESLRTCFKVNRDVNERGRPLQYVLDSIAKRKPDAERYITPQAREADIVFRLAAADESDVEASVRNRRFRLIVMVKDGVYSEPVVHTLIGLCGMQVDADPIQETGAMQLSVEGDITGDDVAMAARALVPHMEELLARQPTWHGGMLGVMQLFSLSYIENALHSRLAYA